MIGTGNCGIQCHLLALQTHLGRRGFEEKPPGLEAGLQLHDIYGVV